MKSVLLVVAATALLGLGACATSGQKQTAEGAIEAHDLRTRHAGRLTFLEFHLVVPGAMSVADAHAIV